MSISELVRDYAISPATAHRDLEALTQSGEAVRVHGGARALDGTTAILETDFSIRLHQAWTAKRVIAAHARRLLEEGSTIFLDHSSTCLALARELQVDPPRSLTIVTNSPAIAYESNQTDIRVIVAPGELEQTAKVICGDWTEEFLSHLNFNYAFVSAGCLSIERGLTTSLPRTVGVLRMARTRAQRTIALIDSSKTKVMRDTLLTIFAATDVDQIIVDDGIEPATLRAYKMAQVNVSVAAVDATSDDKDHLALLTS